jgi:hypothetical protein
MRMWTVMLVLALSAAGCATTQRLEPVDGSPSPQQVEISRGYAALYDLVSRQSGLGRALILGSGMDPETKDLVRAISEASREATTAIESFARSDAQLVLTDRGLPQVDAEARAASEAATTSRLLFAGGRFEVRLLVAQVQATDYGHALAKELSQRDTDPTRRTWLRQFAERYGQFRQKVEDRLAVRKG